MTDIFPRYKHALAVQIKVGQEVLARWGWRLWEMGDVIILVRGVDFW
jgi:hypothetical protein